MVSNTSSANSREQNTKVFELTDKEILETFGFYDDVNDQEDKSQLRVKTKQSETFAD